MSKIAFQKQSVFFRLFSVLFLVSIILILLYVCVIERSGIVNQLCGSKIDIIDNIVETRKNTIENQMVAGWADYESMEDAITGETGGNTVKPAWKYIRYRNILCTTRGK